MTEQLPNPFEQQEVNRIIPGASAEDYELLDKLNQDIDNHYDLENDFNLPIVEHNGKSYLMEDAMNVPATADIFDKESNTFVRRPDHMVGPRVILKSEDGDKIEMSPDEYADVIGQKFELEDPKEKVDEAVAKDIGEVAISQDIENPEDTELQGELLEADNDISAQAKESMEKQKYEKRTLDSMISGIMEDRLRILDNERGPDIVDQMVARHAMELLGNKNMSNELKAIGLALSIGAITNPQDRIAIQHSLTDMLYEMGVDDRDVNAAITPMNSDSHSIGDVPGLREEKVHALYSDANAYANELLDPKKAEKLTRSEKISYAVNLAYASMFAPAKSRLALDYQGEIVKTLDIIK